MNDRLPLNDLLWEMAIFLLANELIRPLLSFFLLRLINADFFESEIAGSDRSTLHRVALEIFAYIHQRLRDVHKADNINLSVRTDQKLQYHLFVLRGFLIEITSTIYIHILILSEFQHAIGILGLGSMLLERTFGA